MCCYEDILYKPQVCRCMLLSKCVNLSFDLLHLCILNTYLDFVVDLFFTLMPANRYSFKFIIIMFYTVKV